MMFRVRPKSWARPPALGKKFWQPALRVPSAGDVLAMNLRRPLMFRACADTVPGAPGTVSLAFTSE